MKHKKSKKIWKASREVMPGGVNSPVRAYKSVTGRPVAMKRGKGAYLKDEDGNHYLDFVNSWGPLILGHAHNDVVKAVKKQAGKGTSLGTITKKELELARYILKHIPHIDLIRFVNSGTEAVMTALRLARGFTDRSKIIKFEGCYHGHSDSMLVQAGSGLLTFSENVTDAGSPGVPADCVSDTVVLPLNEPELLEKAFTAYGSQIAAVIIEPLPANSGVLPQQLSFLKRLRELTLEHGALLILDEVITGFRLGIAGFAGKYFIDPDLVTYGKIIGGGLPVGAVAGKKEIMEHLSPTGPVYQAGTLSGNPLAMTAGLATLKAIVNDDLYEHLNRLGRHLEKEFEAEIKPLFSKDHSYRISLVREESLFWLNIHPPEKDEPVRKVTDIWSKAPLVYRHLFWNLLESGFHMAPSAYEAGFISAAMNENDISDYIRAMKKIIKALPADLTGPPDNENTEAAPTIHWVV